MNELFVLATDSAFTLYWDKPEGAKRDQAYDVLVNGEKAATVCRTHITLEGFAPQTAAEFTVICELDGETLHMQARGKTRAARRRIDVTKAPYLAAGDGETLNTAALQRAFDDCTAEDCLYFPAGVYMTGALCGSSSLALSRLYPPVMLGRTSSSMKRLIKVDFPVRTGPTTPM